tara:strand:+ start:93 stop:350 length:258 start_codon:yes stop_codon:yes gene_type:complete
MSIDIIPEGRTIDPLKIAYEQLIEVYVFLRDKEGEEFEQNFDRIGNVLDQFTGFCCKSVMLDSKYPDDPHVKHDNDWRKSVGIRE